MDIKISFSTPIYWDCICQFSIIIMEMQDKSVILHRVLGELISRLRKEKGVKYLDFCDENSIATSTYDNIVNGTTKPSFYNIFKIIKALGLNFERFGALLDESLPEKFWEEED